MSQTRADIGDREHRFRSCQLPSGALQLGLDSVSPYEAAMQAPVLTYHTLLLLLVGERKRCLWTCALSFERRVRCTDPLSLVHLSVTR
eukprot:162277-Rhodomonas_salina.2